MSGKNDSSPSVRATARAEGQDRKNRPQRITLAASPNGAHGAKNMAPNGLAIDPAFAVCSRGTCLRPARAYRDNPERRYFYCMIDHRPADKRLMENLVWIERDALTLADDAPDLMTAEAAQHEPLPAAPVAASVTPEQVLDKVIDASTDSIVRHAREGTIAIHNFLDHYRSLILYADAVQSLDQARREKLWQQDDEIRLLREQVARLDREVATLNALLDEATAPEAGTVWHAPASESRPADNSGHLPDPADAPPTPDAPASAPSMADEGGADLVAWPQPAERPAVRARTPDTVVESTRNPERHIIPLADLLAAIPAGRQAPLLAVSPVAEKEYQALDDSDKHRALALFRKLLRDAKAVQVAILAHSPAKEKYRVEKLYGMRAAGRLRVLVERIDGGWRVVGFADRADRMVYGKER